MKYIILTDSMTQGLVDQVNKYISDGWEPLGGISSDGNYLLQAMIMTNLTCYVKQQLNEEGLNDGC